MSEVMPLDRNSSEDIAVQKVPYVSKPVDKAKKQAPNSRATTEQHATG